MPINNDANKTFSLVSQVVQTMKGIDAYFLHLFNQQGCHLSRAQIELLGILNEHGSCTQKTLAERTKRDKTSLVRFINTLQKRQLIERSTDANDARLNRISLTAKGMEQWNKIAPCLKDLCANLHANISEKEAQQVHAVLKKIQKNTQTHCIKSLAQ